MASTSRGCAQIAGTSGGWRSTSSATSNQHARLWRQGEKPRQARFPDDDVYFDDHTMAQVMRHAGLLGATTQEGGIGDEQGMRT